MDLSQAMQIVGSEVQLYGRSDADVLYGVTAKLNSATTKSLREVSGLHGGVVLRPFQALHQLSIATKPHYQDDLFIGMCSGGFYAIWASLSWLARLIHCRDSG